VLILLEGFIYEHDPRVAKEASDDLERRYNFTLMVYCRTFHESGTHIFWPDSPHPAAALGRIFPARKVGIQLREVDS
jgi:hypothetical protein